MKTIEIIGENHFETWSKHRTACRGIVMQGEKILLSYEKRKDQYGIPGGGPENAETPEECCAREIAEETGIVVSAEQALFTVKEFYEEWCYVTHFFFCRAIGETERKLTAREAAVGMIPLWVDIKEALSVFSKHSEYAETDEEKRGIYLREYLALSEFLNDKEKRRTS